MPFKYSLFHCKSWQTYIPWAAVCRQLWYIYHGALPSHWLDVHFSRQTRSVCWKKYVSLTSEKSDTPKSCCTHSKMSRLMTKPIKWSVRPVKTQISLNIHPVWSESSQCTQLVAEDPMFLHADSEDSDQTGRMPRLTRVFTGRTCHFVGFVMRRLKFEQSVFTMSKRCRQNCKQCRHWPAPHLGLHCLPRPVCPNTWDQLWHVHKK